MEQRLEVIEKSDKILRIEKVCATIFNEPNFQLDQLDSFERIFFWWYVPGELVGSEEKRDKLLKQASLSHSYYLHSGEVPGFFQRLSHAYALQQNFIHVEEYFVDKVVFQQIKRNIAEFQTGGLYHSETWRIVFHACTKKDSVDTDSDKIWDQLLSIGLPFLRRFLKRPLWQQHILKGLWTFGRLFNQEKDDA